MAKDDGRARCHCSGAGEEEEEGARCLSSGDPTSNKVRFCFTMRLQAGPKCLNRSNAVLTVCCTVCSVRVADTDTPLRQSFPAPARASQPATADTYNPMTRSIVHIFFPHTHPHFPLPLPLPLPHATFSLTLHHRPWPSLPCFASPLLSREGQSLSVKFFSRTESRGFGEIALF